MLEISAFKSFTGHVFDKKDDCIAWEKRARQMQSDVINNLRKDLIASNNDNFPEELLNIIINCEEMDHGRYLQALAKISYWFNNSGLNYEMNIVCYEGSECKKSIEWLSRKQSETF